MRRKIAIALSAGLLLLLQGISRGEALDGSDWKDINELSKITYCKGIAAGTALACNALSEEIEEVLGKNFPKLKKARDKAKDVETEKIWVEKIGTILAVSTNVGDVIETVADKLFFQKIRVGHIVDGMNTFYADFSNERVKTRDAIYIVKMRIDGANPKLIDAQIRYLRMMPNVHIMSDELDKTAEQILKENYQALVRIPYFYCHFWDTFYEEQVIKAIPGVKKANNCKNAVKRGLEKGWITREDFVKVGFYCGEDGNLQKLFCYGNYK